MSCASEKAFATCAMCASLARWLRLNSTHISHVKVTLISFPASAQHVLIALQRGARSALCRSSRENLNVMAHSDQISDVSLMVT